MKKLTAILACGVVASGLLSAGASPILRFSVDDGTTWTSVVDNGPLDSNPALGFISFSGSGGAWVIHGLTGFGAPLVGDPNAPYMDISTTINSTSAAKLIVQLSDTNFVGVANQTFSAVGGGFAGGTATFTAYRDLGNVLFGTGATYAGDPAGVSPSPTASSLMTIGPATGAYQTTNTVVVPTASTPYSLTLQLVTVHTGAARSDSDLAIIAVPPPPCNCAVTFNAPAAITNCADDTIPDVTASQDCGAGPVTVPVTLVSATTNGSCPQTITRIYSATDTCGNSHPFTQTVTVNSNQTAPLRLQ